MKPPLCKFCGVAEWRHVCASNKGIASNNASNRNRARGSSAYATEVSEGIVDWREADAAGVSKVGESAVLGSARKQRWSREAYNAYQREYMRKRRGTVQPIHPESVLDASKSNNDSFDPGESLTVFK